jgi:predicted metal-dependent peptidase
MIAEQGLQQRIGTSIVRLRTHSPFFAVLAMYARVVPVADPTLVDTAATDGRDIFFNPTYLEKLPDAELDGLLLHEVLHAALAHNLRRGEREPHLWNIAADIVVNGMIARLGEELAGAGTFWQCALPPGALREPDVEHLSVEEIYELLLDDAIRHEGFTAFDLLDASPEGGELATQRRAALEAHWREALARAVAANRAVGHGDLPAVLRRDLEGQGEGHLDWRTHLWRYLVQTPCDFQGFDRRFVGRGLYLDALAGEAVQVYVAVDTSGSIANRQLEAFLAEVRAIVGSYPHLECDLYYVDAEAHGPHRLGAAAALPAPVGGGGTSFVPFFARVAERHADQRPGLCVYLTDGHGTFPAAPPALPVLWVVSAGGLELDRFPFGEAVRLVAA